jgi:hypothetical protein
MTSTKVKLTEEGIDIVKEQDLSDGATIGETIIRLNWEELTSIHNGIVAHMLKGTMRKPYKATFANLMSPS